MKQHRKLLQFLTERVDLPAEPLPRIPLVELAGDKRVLIENHDGVCEYGTDRISVQMDYGKLCICGSCMELVRMTREQLIIAGHIDSISLIRGENNGPV